MERDAADLLSRALSADGVETRLKPQVLGAPHSNGEKLLDVANNELRFAIAPDAILLSVGRGPERCRTWSRRRRRCLHPRSVHEHRRDDRAHRNRRCLRTPTLAARRGPRTVTNGIDKGFVKIFVRDGDDQILGATIVAARASEMINEVSVIMHAGIGMRELARIVHTYPAQSGAIRLAALAYWRNQTDMA